LQIQVLNACEQWKIVLKNILPYKMKYMLNLL
jgi:hypothetical protein